MRRLATLAVALLAVAAPAAAQASAHTTNSDLFQSPTGNLRCAYINQAGVGCVRLNDGQAVVLRSFDRAYYAPAGAFYLPAGRTLWYGQTWRVSTFRCTSSSYGVRCWSTLTGRGFFINKTTRYVF
jgi:hypothetical protein